MNQTFKSLTAAAIVAFAANAAYATGYKGDRTDADASASAGADASAQQHQGQGQGQAQIQGQSTEVIAGGGHGGHGGQGGKGGHGGRGGHGGDGGTGYGGAGYGGTGTGIGEGGNASAGADSSSDFTGNTIGGGQGGQGGQGGTAISGGGQGGTGIGEGGTALSGSSAEGGSVGDTTSLSEGGSAVAGGGTSDATGGNAVSGSGSSSDNSVHIDQGGNRVISSVVRYPDTQSVISCDLENKTVTLNTIFGGISWGRSQVGSMEDLERCNLSRVVRQLLIPQAQSEDANMAAEARRHLDAIIPGIQFNEVSKKFLDRFTDVLVAGVNVDKATHSSRRSIFTSVLSNDDAISPQIVDYLNTPNIEQEPVITVVVQDESGQQQEMQMSAECDSKDHCGEVTKAVQAARQAAAQEVGAPSP